MLKSILIVEDEKALLNAYTLLLKAKNYEVFQAENGKQALPILKSKNPDYIILDILMPVMGGVDFLKAADISKNYPSTKVLVLSNLSDKRTVETVMRLGASRYLLKASVSPRELIHTIESL
jgi:DNA-binding response OmpR family regulator